MVDIVHRLEVRAPIAEVFQELACESEPPLASALSTFRYNKASIRATMRVADTAIGRRISWRCVEGPSDWVGTLVTFELAPFEEGTVVRFGHREWAKVSDFMGECSTQWARYLLSLKSRLETPEAEDLYVG
jgi:hypothetical protein